VQIWRRAYDIPPPPVDDDSEWYPANDPKYSLIDKALLPKHECLKDTIARTMVRTSPACVHLSSAWASRADQRLPSPSRFLALPLQVLWQNEIVPDLKAGKVVLIAAHGNSLRGLVKHLDGISDDDIVGLNLPTGRLNWNRDCDRHNLTCRRI
jgi:2,3-bisphosphoglycerate-dependent phosphoglycerate mutase